MEETNFLEEEPHTEEEYALAVTQMLAEIQRLRATLNDDQEEVRLLRAEAASLKSEIATLRAETYAILASLRGMDLESDGTSSGQRLH